MGNDGGRANEPTSYGLQPPDARGAANAARVDQAHRVPPRVEGVPTPVRAGGSGGDPAVGRVLGGRYRLVSRLGHGGMGTVWLAHDEVVDRDVAVKEPRVPDHLGERTRDLVYLRMQREARSAARIDHPSVVTMHDVVIEDAKPWIVMELVRGHSLGDRLQEGTLDPREAARIGLAVLDALTAAHEQGVLHRDVKPDNILLGRGDRVVLSDFGIAQVEGEQGLTETGSFVGSPEFIAPERVLGQRPGPESDLWSLGVVLYAAVEGLSPYRRSNTPATLQAVLSAEPQTPARASGPLGTLVMRLLRKDPASRPDPAEIRQILTEVSRPPVAAAPPRVLDGPAPPAVTGLAAWVPPVLHRNRPARYGLGAATVAGAAALALLLTDPFGGGELPAGWGVRAENEILRAKIAVPEEYQRAEDGAGSALTNVTYYDPSNVFQVFAERVRPDADNEALKPDAAAWKAYYTAGGDSGREIKDADVTTKNAEHQGRKGFETVVDYTEYSASGDDPYRYRWHELVLPGKDGFYLRLRVSMPAEGAAVKDGEELYARVLDHFDLQGKKSA
ncbi:serine/threonine protein kinase [Streptomyces sp. NBC_01317]|uniref:serine/threonine-protein kinase n=1 Tax=Streptomyces sp. NBC_01317 TaxID=2903822 RepID=UPI002E13A140|nr:serine/threonine protein kinase [Streptomyces sp. NBC_01317]